MLMLILIGDLVLSSSSLQVDTSSTSGSSPIVVSGCVNLTGANVSVAVNASALAASASATSLSLDLIQYASNCRSGQFANVNVVNTDTTSCVHIGSSTIDYSKSTSLAVIVSLSNTCPSSSSSSLLPNLSHSLLFILPLFSLLTI